MSTGIGWSVKWQHLPLADADLNWWPQWLNEATADHLLAALRDTIPWEVHRLRLFGRERAAPRLSCWIGDPGTHHTYSRQRFEPRPWPAALQQWRQPLQHACAARFNSVLANFYRDGRDAMGWHSDDEAALGEQPVIASLSLGATRLFRWRRRTPRGVPAAPIQSLPLTHGSLLRMAGATQQHYRHDLPRTRCVVGPRINLTFRWIHPEQDATG